MNAATPLEDMQFARPLSLNAVLQKRNALGGVALPVDSSVGYVRMRHVRGVPAPDGPGYSINKLKMVDNLLERLSQDPRFQAKSEAASLDDQLMDLAATLHDKTARTRPAGYAPITRNERGLLFSLLI